MSSYIPPSRTNLAIAAGILTLFLFQLFVMPHLLRDHVWAMVLITLLLILLNTPLWSLIHEAIHKNFHSHKKLNDFIGRVMSVVFGAGFGVLRFGHLMHHQYNRDWESEHYTGFRIKAWLHHYLQMLGGLYLTEVVMTFLVAALPSVATRKVARAIFKDDSHYQAVLNSLLKADNVRRLRTDALWILLVYGCAIKAFGAAWPVLLLTVAGRAVIISVMDNSYHYGTPADGSVPAKELEASSLYSRFILGFNYHLTHHNNVALPWNRLKETHEANSTPYAQKLVPALLEQFKGPIKTD